jgi:ribonuclease BN (tRNA processing enzyme)
MAKAADAGRLVLTHTGPALCKPGAREKAVAEIADIYDGQTIFAEEGMVLELF